MRDYNEIFWNGTALTATAGSVIIDTKAAGALDGGKIFLNIHVGTALASSGGTATLAIALQSDAASGGSYTTKITTPAIAEASLTAGAKILRISLPDGLERYIWLYATVGTENFTSGTLNAWLSE